MKSPNVKCVCCKKEIYMPKNRLKSFKYCSRECKDKSLTVQITSKCKICENIFTHISCRTNTAKYCSRICYHRSQINRGSKEFKCQFCEQLFYDSPSVKRKYCSIKCVNKKKKEEWHPVYSTVRKKMKSLNMIEKCEKCGYDEIKEILGIHHIDKNRKNNTQKNLRVLCPNCHSIEHLKHISH